jgi:hypothetical protein
MTGNDPTSGPLGDAGERLSNASAATGLLCLLPDGTKVKQRNLRMRACNEVNAKGKLCAGHLKRWYRPSAMAIDALGANAELYRCERCHTIYVPNPHEAPRTRTLAW